LQDDCWLVKSRSRVSRVETMVGYSLWHCGVGRRKKDGSCRWDVRCCPVIRRRRRGRRTLGGAKGQEQASHEEGTSGTKERDHQQNSCGDRHVEGELACLENGSPAGCRSCKAEGRASNRFISGGYFDPNYQARMALQTGVACSRSIWQWLARGISNAANNSASAASSAPASARRSPA